MEWDEYLYAFAELAAKKSKDATKVGAVLVAPNGRSVLLTAYNGPPPGVLDLPERRERPRKYLFANHAERNLIATAARHGIRTEGATVYCTHRCCANCAGEMIAAGIYRFVYGPGRFVGDDEQWVVASTMLYEARVSFAPAVVLSQESDSMIGPGHPLGDWMRAFCKAAPGLVLTREEADVLVRASEAGDCPEETAKRILEARR